MSLSACPDCGSDLGRNATKCRCGWKTSSVSMPSLTKPCAQETCTTPAFVREETPTGWAEFCLFHYKKYHSERAALWCKEHDLYSKQDMIEFCKKRIGKVFKA